MDRVEFGDHTYERVEPEPWEDHPGGPFRVFYASWFTYYFRFR